MKIKEMIVYRAFCSVNAIHSIVDSSDTFEKLRPHVRSLVASKKVQAHKISHVKSKV